MSHKKAKKIRKEIGYSPNKDKHKYVLDRGSGQISVHPTSKRALYLSMKREA